MSQPLAAPPRSSWASGPQWEQSQGLALMRVFGPWGIKSVHVSWAVHVDSGSVRGKAATVQWERHAMEQKQRKRCRQQQTGQCHEPLHREEPGGSDQGFK